jgi:hypothetical protein
MTTAKAQQPGVEQMDFANALCKIAKALRSRSPDYCKIRLDCAADRRTAGYQEYLGIFQRTHFVEEAIQGHVAHV